MSGILRFVQSVKQQVRVSPKLTQAEIRELKERAAADGRSVAQYVAVLIVEDIKKRKPVLRTSHRDRKNPKSYELHMSLTPLDRARLEARAKAEVRSLSGYVARVIVKDLGI